MRDVRKRTDQRGRCHRAEPLPADAPLRSRPEVILTPYLAFYSTESMERLQRLAEEGRRALAREPLRLLAPLLEGDA